MRCAAAWVAPVFCGRLVAAAGSWGLVVSCSAIAACTTLPILEATLSSYGASVHACGRGALEPCVSRFSRASPAACCVVLGGVGGRVYLPS